MFAVLVRVYRHWFVPVLDAVGKEKDGKQAVFDTFEQAERCAETLSAMRSEMRGRRYDAVKVVTL